MTKRGASYELTQKNVEALLADFQESHAAALTKENKTEPSATPLLTREEALRSGRSIIKLKRRLSAPEPSTPVLEGSTATAQSKADKRASEGAELNRGDPVLFAQKCVPSSSVREAQEKPSDHTTEPSAQGPESHKEEVSGPTYAGPRKKEQPTEEKCSKRQKVEANEAEDAKPVAPKEKGLPCPKKGVSSSSPDDTILHSASEAEEDQKKTRCSPDGATSLCKGAAPFDGATGDGASESPKAGHLESSASADSASKPATTGAEASGGADGPPSSSDSAVPSFHSGEAQNSSAPSIFGNFFSCPFTNPFAQAAANAVEKNAFSSTGKESDPCKAEEVPLESVKPSSFVLFPGQSIFSVNPSEQPKPTSGTASKGLEPEVFDSSGEDSGEGQTAAARPAQFLGEEDDKEIFFDNHVTLLKCTPVTVEVKASEEKAATEGVENSKSQTRVTYKFKRQGEGLLRVLQARRKEGVPQSPPSDCRLVIRQKGTWNLLLNSPLSLAQRFDIVPQLASGFGLRFVGIDHSHKDAQDSPSSTSSPPLAAYCLKFATEGQRRAFLIAAGYPTTS